MTAPTTAFRMPGRHHPYAPKFDGTPTLLDVFFDDVEQLAKACNISGADKIAWTIRYAPIEDRQLWEFTARDIHGKTLKQKFAHTTLDRTAHGFTPSITLNRLPRATRASPWRPRTILQNITVNFARLLISSRAKTAFRIGKQAHILSQGFHPNFRQKVLAQLRAESPTHHPDDPYKVSCTYSAALFILSCDQNVAGDYSEQASKHIKSIPKQSNAETLQAMMVILAAEVSKIINAPTSQQPAHQGAYLFPAPQHQISLQPRTSRCVFCSEFSHHLRDCPRAEEYMKSGRCKRSFEGRIILPDGEIINRQAENGKNLKECIDRWHEEKAPINSINHDENKAPEDENSDAYLPSQFHYTWLKDDVADQAFNDTSAKIQERVEPEIFQSFSISQLEQAESMQYTSQCDGERDSSANADTVKYFATSVDAQIVPRVTPAVTKIDAQIISRMAASVPITYPANYILTRSTTEDMYAAHRLLEPLCVDHPPKVKSPQRESFWPDKVPQDDKAPVLANMITPQPHTRRACIHDDVVQREFGFDLHDEATGSPRALSRIKLPVPCAHISPIKTGAQEKSPTTLIRRNLQDHKPGSVVRVPTDMQQSKLYPREWKRDATVPRQRTGYAQKHEIHDENGGADCLHLKSPRSACR